MTETFRQQQDRMFRERVEREADVKARREAWEKNERDKAELRNIEERRAEVEARLVRRGEEYLEDTGTRPSAETVGRWRDEVADELHTERQAERQERYDQAAANDRIF